MEDVLAETAITYPETYVQEMTGAQIKDVLEDICDNLFNPDPYYQQGGDMVRVGGLSLHLHADGRDRQPHLRAEAQWRQGAQAGKRYKVAGWASVNGQQGAPVWDVVAKYLRSGRMFQERLGSGVTLKGVEGNPGIAGQG